MKKNLGTLDRTLRLLAAVALVIASMLAPWPPSVRFGLLLPTAIYFAFNAMAGTCFGYTLMGRSTCPATKAS